MKLINPDKEYINLTKATRVLAKLKDKYRWRFEGPIIKDNHEVHNLTDATANDLCLSIAKEYPGSCVRHTSFGIKNTTRYILTRQSGELILTIDKISEAN